MRIFNYIMLVFMGTCLIYSTIKTNVPMAILQAAAVIIFALAIVRDDIIKALKSK